MLLPLQRSKKWIKTSSPLAMTHTRNALKAKAAKASQLKHDRGVKRAENHAERLEWEASFAIDYAVAAIEEAKSAVLDAIVGRIEAEGASRS